MSCVCVCLCVCLCVLCKLGTQIEMQSVELHRIHVHVTMFVSECLYHHQTGVLFATCITGVCKYAVRVCVCVCVCVVVYNKIRHTIVYRAMYATMQVCAQV